MRRAAAVGLTGVALTLLASSCGRRAEVLVAPDPDRASAPPTVHVQGGSLPPGSACGADTDCASGACAGGYCCTTPCVSVYCGGDCTYYAFPTCNATGACQYGEIIPSKGGTICGYCGGMGDNLPDMDPGLPETSGNCDANCHLLCTPHEGEPCYPSWYDQFGAPPPPGVCMGGYCVLVPMPNGTPCDGEFPQVCQSGFCTDAICCDSACPAPCNTCWKSYGASADGVCTPIPGCGAPDAGSDGGTGGGGTGGGGTATTGTGGAAACAHSPCVMGSALADGCDPCVTAVCALDPYCCNGVWKSQCVSEAASACGSMCGGAGAGGVSAAGSGGAGGASVVSGGGVTSGTSVGSSVVTGSGTSSAGSGAGGGAAPVHQSACAAAPRPARIGPWAALLLLLARRQRRA